MFVASGRGILGLVLCYLAACATPQRAYVTNAQIQDDGRPRWVAQGSAPVKSKQDRLFYGVAGIRLEGNFSEQTVIADQRAKVEALRVLQGYLTVLSRDLLATGGLGEADFVSRVPDQLKSFSEKNLDHVSIVGHWRDDQAAMLYSIAELDLHRVGDALTEDPSVDPALRQYFQARADGIFDRIADKARPTTTNIDTLKP